MAKSKGYREKARAVDFGCEKDDESTVLGKNSWEMLGKRNYLWGPPQNPINTTPAEKDYPRKAYLNTELTEVCDAIRSLPGFMTSCKHSAAAI